MRRSIVCAVVIGAAVFVLVGATMARSRVNGAGAATATAVAPSFYTALDCDLGTPGIQDTCSLAPGTTHEDVGVVFFNNSSAPYTISALALRVLGTGADVFPGARLVPLDGPFSPTVDLNPDFNEQDLPGAWSCSRTWLLGGVVLHGGETLAPLTCSDVNGIGNVIAANSSVTVAVVHYRLTTELAFPAGAVPFRVQFFAADPANADQKGCSSPSADPCYGATINVPATGVTVVLDCDVAAPGIQDNCTLPPGAPSADVGVVLVNNTASAIQLGAFDFLVEDPDQGRLNPPEISGPIADRNPDLNQAELSNTFVCLAPEADTGHGSPGTVQSSLFCYDAVASPPTTIAAGGQLRLATVHYAVPLASAPGSVRLSLSEISIANADAVVIADCFSECSGATVNIVSAPVNPPTPTALPSPTATPTSAVTPVVLSTAPSSTPTADIYFAVDCDLTHAGVQSDCTYRLGDAADIDVGFVLVNNGPQLQLPLAVFDFELHMADHGRLSPLPSIFGLDGNPNFNDAGIAGDWQCPKVVADTGSDGPGGAVSQLGCLELGDPGGGPLLATGSELLLGTVRYGVAPAAQPGSVPLRVGNASASDPVHVYDPLADCREDATAPQPCLPATLHLIAYPAITKVPAGVGANVDPALPAANLWVCQIGLCIGPGEGDLEVVEHVTGVITGDQNGDSVPDGLGAYEFQVEFDSLVIQSVNPSDIVFSAGGAGAARGPANCSMSIVFESLVRFGCVTSGQTPGPEGSFDLAKLDLIPAADDLKDLFPGNDNGIPTLIKDNQCELADVFGHPVQGTIDDAGLLPACGDLFVTVRILEGDLNLDCMVDVADEALIAAHYGAFFGSAFYNKWFDLEPRFHDLDIDIKDLQKVFGRDGSTCQQPIPVQTPVVPPFPLEDEPVAIVRRRRPDRELGGYCAVKASKNCKSTGPNTGNGRS